MTPEREAHLRAQMYDCHGLAISFALKDVFEALDVEREKIKRLMESTNDELKLAKKKLAMRIAEAIVQHWPEIEFEAGYDIDEASELIEFELPDTRAEAEAETRR